MRRRKFLIGAGSFAAATAGAIGTGAFTSVQADRSVTVETAGDGAALLELTKARDSNGNVTPNAQEYVSFDGDNLVQIDVPNANKDAYTVIRKLIDMRNAGTQQVVITHEQDFPPQKVFFFHDHTTDYWTNNVSQAGDVVGGWPSSTSDPGITNLAYTDWGNYAIISSGSTLKFFGMGIGLGSDDGEIGDETITINAKTPQEYSVQDGAPSP